MKIAFTTTGKTWESAMDARFGRAPFLLMFDENSKEISFSDNTEAQNHAHGAGTATSQVLASMAPDILITGNGPGETAAKALKLMNIRIFTGAFDMSAAQAYDMFKENKLQEMNL